MAENDEPCCLYDNISVDLNHMAKVIYDMDNGNSDLAKAVSQQQYRADAWADKEAIKDLDSSGPK